MALLLSGSDVQRVLHMEEAIDMVERAFVEFGEGRVDMPQRPVIFAPENIGLSTFMPALLPGMGVLSIKIVSVFKDNVKKGLPAIMGTVTVLDPETGAPLAIMDGGYLTAVRTGAASAVATKYLAREDAHVAAILGAGVQARTQLEGVCTVRNIDQVRVFDIDGVRAEGFAKEMSGHGRVPANIEVASSPREAIVGAHIVVTATTSPSPLFDGDDLSPGTHINGVGSHAAGVRELDTKTAVRSRIVCDSVEACLAEAGDLIIPLSEGAISKADIHAGLADVIAGKVPGRQSDDEVTLFKSVGLAFEDASVALQTYERARKEGLGTEFQF